MDRLIYTAMSGAKQVLEQQTTVAHNMANASTTGFRAQIDAFRAVSVVGVGLPTRTQVVDDTVGADFSNGRLRQTGRDLDVAVDGVGWIAVQSADGTEAYTRAGALKINPNGILQTQAGLTVLGSAAPMITIAGDAPLMFGKDGTVSALTPGSNPVVSVVLGQVKLVNPPSASLVRGDDGLFRTHSGKPVAPDPGVRLVSGALEDSNVNVVETMVRMIGLGRQFDLHMNLLKNAENNAAKADQILNLG